MSQVQETLREQEVRMVDLESRLAARQARIASLQTKLAARDSRILDLEAQIAARDGEVAALKAELADRERQVESLLASTSWKVSAPLRLVGRNLRNGVRRLPLRPGTGLWKTVRSAYRALPLPGSAKDRLLHVALRKGYLSASAAPLEEDHVAPAPQAEHPVVAPLQEPWPESLPLVSVVIPCFNYGRFVAEAVDSVLAQTFQDLEVIVVDGGSDESTLRTLKALRRPKTRIYFRSGRHLVGDNRNYGISRARGKYVCCLDADDLLRPTYLEKAVFLLEAGGYDVVSTSIQCFGEDTNVYRVKRHPVLADMVEGNHVPTCAVFSKDLWERAGGFQDNGIGREYIYEDWRLWLRFSALGARIANIVEEPLFLYRCHSRNSLSKQQEMPDVDAQRAAVVAFNRDVIDEEAFRLSAERSRQRIRTLDPLLHLRGRQRPEASSSTVLIALPFLIVGGAERLLSEVAVYLRSRGYRLVFVTTLPVDPQYGDATSWFEPATAEIYHLPRFLDPEHWRDFVFYLIETKDVSLLWLAGSAFFYDLLPEIEAEWPGLKVIDLLFNTVGHTANNRKHRALIDLTLVENREVHDWLRARGETSDRVLLVPSGVDLERFRPAPKPDPLLAELDIEPSSFVVGFSGRLSEEKSPELFLELAERCREDSRLVFLMTGAGPLAEAVRQRVEGLGMGDRLRFLGKVDDVRDYLALYDLLVLPSRLDGRPVVVLESLAMGVPVVASRVGALPELITEGETGFLCDPGDVACLVERVRWLADRPEEHRRMKAAARSYAEGELDARRMLRRYEEAVRDVLSRPRETARARPVTGPFPPGEGNPIVLTLPFFTVGGAERVIETLLAGWREEGRTVVVFTTEPLQSGMADRIGRLRELTPFCYPLCEMLPRERWLDCVVETLLVLPQPTLLSVGCPWFYEVAEELRARVPWLRIVDQLFNAVCHLDLNRRVAASLDATVAAYAGLADMVLADGRPPEQGETIYVGIERPRLPDRHELECFRARLDVPPNGRLIAFVGRLAEEKRPDWLIRLCREIEDPDVRFLVVGDGPLAAILEAGARGDGRLRWLRRVDAVETALAAADVVVLPSRFEGIPLVLMEALALGRPAVASRVGGIPELAGTPGLELVDPDDFAGFRDAVLRLLAEPPSGVELPSRFFAEAMIRRYDEILFGGG